jgi:hypothetical protein
MKLFEVGIEKINAELDILKLIKNMKNLKIIMKNKFMNDEKELFYIYHH